MKNDRKVIPFPTTVSEAEMNAALKKMYQEAATARSTDWVAFIEEIATEGRWYLKDAELFRDLFVDWAIFYETDDQGKTPHGRFLEQVKEELSPSLYRALRGLADPMPSLFQVEADGVVDLMSKQTYQTDLTEIEVEAGDLLVGKLLYISGKWRFAIAYMKVARALVPEVLALLTDFVDEVGEDALLRQYPEFCAELIDLLLDIEEGNIAPRPEE